MRLRHNLTEFSEWDIVARRIIQDPYSVERSSDWEQLNQWMLKILRGYLRTRVRPDMPLEDVQQYATEALIGALETYDPLKDPKPSRHILSTVRYRMADLDRAQGHQVATTPMDPRTPTLLVADLDAPSMEDQIVDRLALQDALSQLKTAERTVIQCTFYHDWTDQQISQTFGWPTNRIYQYRFQALRSLRELLQNDMDREL